MKFAELAAAVDNPLTVDSSDLVTFRESDGNGGFHYQLGYFLAEALQGAPGVASRPASGGLGPATSWQ